MGSMLGLGMATLMIGGANEAVGQPKKPAGWMTSYAEARQAARQTGKPIFLVFR